MILPLFLLALPFALWWAALWLALPVDWDALTLPNLVVLHVGPPLAAILAWGLAKRLWVWRAKRRKERAAKAEKAEQQQAREAALAAHKQALEARRAHVECRGVWASLASPPNWGEGLPPPCVLIEQNADTVRSTKQDEAISNSLQEVLEAALKKNEALAWLPVYVASGNSFQGAAQTDNVRQVWQQAIKVCQSSGMYQTNTLPSSPDCRRLIGEGSIMNQVLTLFEQDPYLPALLLFGLDSPLSEMSEDDSHSKHKPSHAVLALLLARPGLVAETAEPSPPEGEETDPNLIPHWNRPVVRVNAPSVWGRVPVNHQHGFLEKLPALAVLTRSRLAAKAERPGIFAIHLQQAIEEAFIDAGLRDLPFREKKGKQKEDTAQDAQDVPDTQPDTPIAPEIGWLVHDSHGPNSLTQIGEALCGCKSDLKPMAQATSVLDEHGNVGTAHGVFMQALALARATQLQKPVLLAETLDEKGITLAFTCPCKQNHDPAAT